MAIKTRIPVCNLWWGRRVWRASLGARGGDVCTVAVEGFADLSRRPRLRDIYPIYINTPSIVIAQSGTYHAFIDADIQTGEVGER
jgi:hypothetical protein